MNDNSKQKLFKKKPSIKTSINDVEFKEQLFIDKRREKFNSNLNNISSNNNHIKQNINQLEESNNSENNNINEFKKKDNFDFLKPHDREIHIQENHGDISNNSNDNDNNFKSIDDCNLNNFQNYNYPKNNYINIRENSDYLKENIHNYENKEFNHKYKNYRSDNNPIINNKKIYCHNKDICDNYNFNDNKAEKFHFNYNYSDTPAVYESTVSKLNTEENEEIINSKNYSKGKINSITKKEKLNNKYKKESNTKSENSINPVNESFDDIDYIITNRTIKIPKRYLKNINKEDLKFKPSSPEEEEEIKARIWELLEKFYKFLDESRFDPVLDTFKNNEILQEFFVQRILELIANIFDSEKELYLQKLNIEKKELQKNLNETQKTYEELNAKLSLLEENLKKSQQKEEEIIINFDRREQDLIKTLKQKEEKINHLLAQLDFQEKEFTDLCNNFTQMNRDFENYKAIHEKTVNENSLLKSKIRHLEEEVNISNKRFDELNLINQKYEEENSTLTKQLNKFRDDYEQMKIDNEKNKSEMNKYIEENFSFKIKLEEKVKFIDELMEKYESNKRESQEKITKYENDLDKANKKNAFIEDTIKKTYKVKNTALKNKLKEKVDLIENKNIEFDNYKQEKEKLIAKMLYNHQTMLDEKNRIIEEMMRINK